MNDILKIAFDIAVVIFCVVGVIAIYSLVVGFFDDRRYLREMEEKKAREILDAEVSAWRKNGGL